MFLAACIVAYLVYKTYVEGRLDHEYASKGLVSPRLQAKYGDTAAAKTSRYGLRDYLADAWSDNWANRTEARRAAYEAARDAEPSNPDRSGPSWRDRQRAVKAAAVKAARVVVQPVEVKPQPVQPDPTPDQPAADAADVDGQRTCPDCGATLTHMDGNWRHPDRGNCPHHAAQPDPPSCPVCGWPYWQTSGGPRCACSNRKPNQPKETPVTAPTGEAVNYETTIAELDALIAYLRQWLEALTVALAKLEEAKNHVSDSQDGYRPAAKAAPSILEHLAALHLDAHTLGLISAIAEAMPASAVDEILALLEEAEAKLKSLRDAAATALEAAEAAKAHVVSQYSAAHETVAGNLSGDSRFVSSGAAA